MIVIAHAKICLCCSRLALNVLPVCGHGGTLANFLHEVKACWGDPNFTFKIGDGRDVSSPAAVEDDMYSHIHTYVYKHMHSDTSEYIYIYTYM